MMVIIAKICPEHIEATSFAFIVGISNFKWTISSYMGK